MIHLVSTRVGVKVFLGGWLFHGTNREYMTSFLRLHEISSSGGSLRLRCQWRWLRCCCPRRIWASLNSWLGWASCGWLLLCFLGLQLRFPGVLFFVTFIVWESKMSEDGQTVIYIIYNLKTTDLI